MNEKIFPLIEYKESDFSPKNASVLALESHFFNIFTINIDIPINYEDRILKIEDKLEGIFPKYNFEDYILKYEFLKKDSQKEYLLVYLLELKLLEEKNIIDYITNYKIISLIPNFLKAREYKYKNFYSFDISKNFLIISKYDNSEIKEVNIFIIDYMNNDYLNLIEVFLKNIDTACYLVFTGIEIDFELLDLKKYHYEYFSPTHINLKKYPNFLPKNFQKKYYLYYMNARYFFILLLITIFFIFICAYIHFKINNLKNEINDFQSQNSLLEESNLKIQKEIVDVENEISKLEKDKKKLQKTDFKISDFLKDLTSLIPIGIKIKSIQFDGKDILILIVDANNFSNINTFLGNLESSPKLKLENYDYIINSSQNIESKIELKYL